MMQPRKGSGALRHAGSVRFPVTPKKRGFKEIILTTTAGYIASIAVIACFFLIAAIGA